MLADYMIPLLQLDSRAYLHHYLFSSLTLLLVTYNITVQKIKEIYDRPIVANISLKQAALLYVSFHFIALLSIFNALALPLYASHAAIYLKIDVNLGEQLILASLYVVFR